MIILSIFYKVFIFTFMHYSKLQKIISSLLIFFILTSFTIRVPFFALFWGIAKADDDNRYNIVSIIVEKNLYNSLQSKIERYARDIQWVLEQTKTIIVPTEKETHPFNIASLNEKLYFEWWKWFSWLWNSSQLIWTVIIWDLPLPVVFTESFWEKTLLPYVDFYDKAYIYNHDSFRYEPNENKIGQFEAEIWHWVISPNTWNDSSDISAVSDYLDKNHDFYEWTWNFELDKWIINWDLTVWVKSTYKPYVFYFDQIRENKSINYINYQSYERYLENIEDLTYNRFTKKLIKKLKDWDKAAKQAEMESDLKTLWLEWLDISAIWGPDVDNVWDIQTRHFLKEYTKKFLEIFNGSTIGDFRKDVNNAWRYSAWPSVVNADFAPVIVSALDELSKKIIKNVNNTLENEIDEKVKADWSKDIMLPTKFINNHTSYSWTWGIDFLGWDELTYTNILYWRVADTIDSAEQCTIYRWSISNSWTLVEANRAFNIKDWIRSDISRLQSESTSCTSAIESWESLKWYRWKNTWLRLEFEQWSSIPTQKPWADKSKAILDLFDIWGAQEVTSSSLVPSPLDCIDSNNYIYTNRVDYDYGWGTNTTYNVPLSWNPSDRKNWSCKTDNIRYNLPQTYDDVIANLWSTECTHKRVYVNWSKTHDVKTERHCPAPFDSDTCYCGSRTRYDYYYKSVPSYITHKSPTSDEIRTEIQTMTTPALPVDRDRYIDFINTSGSYEKIDYPQLFRINAWTWQINLEDVDIALQDYLASMKPRDFDLYQYLKSKPDKTLTIDWDSIEWVSYYDTLVFGIYWNSLASVPAKYKYVFENYLSDQTWPRVDSDWNPLSYVFPLPMNRKSYEITYLWAPWDASNMYIKVDPEEKGKNPYADLIWLNLDLKNKLNASNTWWDFDNAGSFKCAPPEWVPIWEWFPAVLCRLKEMLPPTIKIWDGNCWETDSDDNWLEDLLALDCNKDDNKNSIIDCFETQIDSISLDSDSEKYFYNTSWDLHAEVLWLDWKRLKWASGLELDFELVKVVIPKDPKKEFSWSNMRTLYDVSMESSSATSEETRKLVEKYINFKNISIKSAAWSADYNFSSKSKDADISFRVKLVLKDQHGATVLSKISDNLDIRVRWDRFIWSTYNISEIHGDEFIDSWASSVIVSDLGNVFVVDSNNYISNNEDSILELVKTQSSAKEKFVISLANISKSGTHLSINYPVEYEIFKDWEITWSWVINTINWVQKLESMHEDENWLMVNSFQKTWGFVFKFKDASWFKFEKEVEFLPEVLSQIKPEMSTTIQELWDVTTTHLVKLLDKYWNLTRWDIYSLDVDINWWLTLEGDKKSDTYSIYEWYKAFTLTSPNIEIWTTNVITFTVVDEEKWIDLSREVKLTTLKEIPFEVKFLWTPDELKVWWKSSLVEINIQIPSSASLNEMDRFNSRAYLTFPSIYGNLDSPFITINNNNGAWIFTTKVTAVEKLDVQVTIEWIKEPKIVPITIYPEVPMRTELTLDKSKIEASPSAKSNLKVELKDRYWNTCFNDSVSNFSIEVLDKYSSVITPTPTSASSIKWVWEFVLYWTDTPWVAYFKTTVSPSLEWNSFTISDGITDLNKDWIVDELTINWISSNAWKINTYYFWNKLKTDPRLYNWIYTTLLGANYWDVTEKDYLAWALIFNKNNRSLAVSSLLNNPFKYDDVLTLSKDGLVDIISWSNNLSQNIDIETEWNKIHIYNKSLNTLIGQILYNFDKPINEINEIDTQNSKIITTRDIDNLYDANYLNSTKWNFVLYLASTSYSTRDAYLSSSTKWEVWKVIYFRDPFETKPQESDFESVSDLPYSNFNDESWIGWKWMNQTLLSFASSRSVWESTKEFMWFGLINIWDPVVSLKKVKKKLPWTEIYDPITWDLFFEWYDRKFEDSLWDIIDKNVESYKVFDYNNDWRDDIVILRTDWTVSLYENSNITEKFEYKWPLVRLSDLWSNAIMEAWDFTWDGYDDLFFVTGKSKPILLNNNLKDFVRYDLSNRESFKNVVPENRIIQAIVFDMDADWKDDIVTFDDWWSISIFYWKWWTAANPRFDYLQVGSGLGIQLSQTPRTDWGYLYFDSLYQLPENWQTETASDAEKLSETIQDNLDTLKDGWWMDAIFPDGKINDDAIDQFIFQKLNYNPNNALSAWEMSVDEKKAAILWAMPESIMTPEMQAWIANQSAAAWDIANAVSTWSTAPVEPEPLATPWISWVDWAIVSASSTMTDLLNGWLEDLNPWMTWYDAPNDRTMTTFVKSEYADATWVDIKKVYKDINWWSLKSWDLIDVTVTITNNTTSSISKIAYIENIDKPFAKWDDFSVSLELPSWTWGVILKENIAWWEGFLIDLYTVKDLDLVTWYIFDRKDIITLAPWEDLKIKYKLVTSPFKFWYIQAWLFEKDELGDDIYWDVSFKPKKQNCWEEFKLFRSTAVRSYEAWLKTPDCDEDKAWLPEPFDKNGIDENGNGIPDYIDAIADWAQWTADSATAWSSWTTEFEDFANWKIDEMNKDSDWDGIPDREDSTPNSNDDDDFMESLDNFTEEWMAFLEWVEQLLNWLSCWFWWGWCISMPVNAAPLAPWSSITVLWCPVAPAGPSNLFVAMSWIPIFSLLTLWPIMPFGIPTPPLWPPNFIWAGWIFGFAPGPLRIFLTPTLTWAIGTAICFWDNVASPYALFPWIYPLLSGWNCIIAAMPFFGCSDDWSDWDIAGTWLPSVSSANWWFGVFDWNCEGSTWNEWKTPYLWKDNVKDYYEFKKTWTSSPSLTDRLKQAMMTINNQSNPWPQPNWPLLNMDMWGWPNDMALSIDLDFSALADWNFWDILKVKLNRIWAFPDFIHDWVTRQVEEIINKLTDFPTLFIILPDFSWIFDWWENVWEIFNKEAWWPKWKFGQAKEKAQQQYKAIEAEIKSLDEKCPDVFSDKWSLFEDTDPYACKKKADLEKKLFKMWLWEWMAWNLGWIKAAFNMISNLPLLSIEPQPVYVNVPWIDKWILAKTIISRKATVAQRKQEWEDTKDSWTCWATCESWDNQCEEKNWGCLSIWLDMDNLISSIEKNIEILEWYKKFPEDLNKLIRIKEVRLSQILCYIDTIAFLVWWRIKKNWKIFKTWVELYILIKAILKTWQLIIDIFYDFDVECHECKNEKTDLRYCVLKLLSMLIPQIPIIEFPKWPDIIVDLHHIRAWLIIGIPDFTMKLRPIMLPELPNLYLPKLPPLNISLELPAIPILPELKLPELPMLPGIPTIELPDLPPAPTLPKLFAALEAILTILKLLLKIYCLLQKSFLAPEWAAWQRIAHITERTGYLPLDFIPLELPNFSYPFIDAIKVTTYVNFEFEVDFIVEYAKQLVMPINAFTNNIVNMLNIWVDDLDFRWLVPESIDVNISTEWTSVNVDWNEVYNEDAFINTINRDTAWISLFTLTWKIAIWIAKIVDTIDKQKDDYVSNYQFLSLINKDLNKKWIIEDTSFDWIRDIWDVANNEISSNSKNIDNLIEDLKNNNDAKFEELKNIVQNEQYKNSQLIKKLESWELFEWVSIESVNKSISSLTYTDFDLYNDSLKTYNDKTFDAIKVIVNWEVDSIEEENIRQMWDWIIDKANIWMDYFNSFIEKWKEEFLNKNPNFKDSSIENINNKVENNVITAKDLLAVNNNSLLADSWTSWDWSTSEENKCATWKPNTYNYEWLYISEEDPRDPTKAINYRLFNYLDDYTGKEEVTIIDYDNDLDEDLLFQLANTLYLKTNLETTDTKIYLDTAPVILNFSDTVFSDINNFQESVNGFYESVASSYAINLQFSQPTDLDINNFAIEYFTIVDKYTAIDKWYNEPTYKPAWVKRSIIDSFSEVDNNTLAIETNTDGTYIRKNLATLTSLWQTKGVIMKTNKLDNIGDTIALNNSLVISEWTRIYSWGDSVILTYLDENEEDINNASSFVIPSNSNVEFEKTISIIWISWNAYLKSNEIVEYSWNMLTLRLNKPIFDWTVIEIDNIDVPYNENNNILIKYYDGTTRSIYTKESLRYDLVDLWELNDTYQVQISLKNDFYYAKIRSFKNNIFSTESNQTILSPQLANDLDAPELNGLWSIRIPVYQDKAVDITSFIYEGGWNSNIKDIYFSPDADIDWYYTYTISEKFINLNFTAFDRIFKKKLKLFIIDKNDNIWEIDIPFEVYSPIPNIITDNNIKKVSWVLDESLFWEPVSVYRARVWWISKLGISDTVDNGVFDYNVTWWSWLVIKAWTAEALPRDIATINEDTWMINNILWSIKVYSSNNINNDLKYPKIVLEYWWKEVYYQSFNYEWEWYVNVVDSLNWNTDKWIYLKISDLNYSTISISNNAKYNPWAVYGYKISDVTKKPLFTVFSDWRINISDNFKLEYSLLSDYGVLNIVDKFDNSIIARVLVITDNNFIIK